MNTVTTPQVTSEHEGAEELPERVTEALGELAGAAREGLMALSVGVGLGVLAELMEAEVEEVVGPRGAHDPDRSAKRHGPYLTSCHARWSSADRALCSTSPSITPHFTGSGFLRSIRRECSPVWGLKSAKVPYGFSSKKSVIFA